MRLLLLMLFIIMCSYGIAQNPQVQITPKLYGKELSKPQLETLLKLYKMNPQMGNKLVRLKRKPGISYLADGMPCIVPEKPTAGIIPNAFKGTLIYTIPNPALPKKSKPKSPGDM